MDASPSKHRLRFGEIPEEYDAKHGSDPVVVPIRVSLPNFEPFTKGERIVIILVYILLAMFPILLLGCIRVVEQYNRAVIIRLGKLRADSPSGPGIVFGVYFLLDRMIKFDIRTRTINLSPQEILTKDHVTMTVESVIYYHISCPMSCLMNIVAYKYATTLLAVALLRNILGKYTLTDVLSSRKIISLKLREDMIRQTYFYGVFVERVEIKDVVLPVELQKAMATEAEGKRLAKAKVIVAEGEIKTAENLRDASKIIVNNPKIMLLRYLQSLNFIAADHKSSIMFPFPIDLPE